MNRDVAHDLHLPINVRVKKFNNVSVGTASFETLRFRWRTTATGIPMR